MISVSEDGISATGFMECGALAQFTMKPLFDNVRVAGTKSPGPRRACPVEPIKGLIPAPGLGPRIPINPEITVLAIPPKLAIGSARAGGVATTGGTLTFGVVLDVTGKDSIVDNE